MDLKPYRPMGGLFDLHRELNRFFESPWATTTPDGSTVETSQWVPAVDIREAADHYEVEADIPGVKPSDIEVTMEHGMLSIQGERHDESSREEHGARRLERSHGVFYRRFALPDDADPDAIEAKGDNGVLTVTIGKQKEAHSRRIPVKH